MAAGVPMDKVYPIDIDKAYDSLAKIKPAVVKWWEAGAIPAQLLNDKEVTMGIAWDGRIAAIQAKGAPVEVAWMAARSEEHTSELQSHSDIVCRLLPEKKQEYALVASLARQLWT